MDGLIAAAEPDPERRGDAGRPHFLNHNFDASIPASITRSAPARAVGQISRSLFDKEINPVNEPASNPRKGALTWGSAQGPENQHLRVLSRRVDLTPDTRSDADYTFLVAGDMAEVDRQTREFNTTLFWSFLLLGFGIDRRHPAAGEELAWRPCASVSCSSLAKIRDGEARRLDGNFPTEIAPLAGELNSLIQHSEEVVGRARTHVSNLAHFLKTPLSVLAAEADAATGPARGHGQAPGLFHAPPGGSLLCPRPRRRLAGCAGQPHPGQRRAG